MIPDYFSFWIQTSSFFCLFVFILRCVGWKRNSLAVIIVKVITFFTRYTPRYKTRQSFNACYSSWWAERSELACLRYTQEIKKKYTGNKRFNIYKLMVNFQFLTCESQMGCFVVPVPSLPNMTASRASPSNISLQITLASLMSQESSQIVPHLPSWKISTRPSKWVLPPTSLIWR